MIMKMKMEKGSSRGKVKEAGNMGESRGSGEGNKGRAK